MKIKIVLILIVLILLAGTVYALISLSQINTNAKLETSQVIIDNKVINVELAQTPAQQAKGLGDRGILAEDSGMLFVFPNLTIRNFWMKDMKFPIDIIWIKNDTIVGIEANAPIPFEKDSPLPIYSSPTEVNYVLEVNAGFCEKNKIGKGDKVTVEVVSADNGLDALK